MGVTHASFQVQGSTPASRDLLRRAVTVRLCSFANSFRIMAGISSGPAAFPRFRFSKSLHTPSVNSSRGLGAVGHGVCCQLLVSYHQWRQGWTGHSGAELLVWVCAEVSARLQWEDALAALTHILDVSPSLHFVDNVLSCNRIKPVVSSKSQNPIFAQPVGPWI